MVAIVPPYDHVLCYFQKEFYSYLLQGVVVVKRKFWEYDFGWCGRIHDQTLFQKSKIRKKTMKGALLPFNFIGDVA
jgi:hypothetical protein